jgi:hypothetical protein
MQSGQPRDPNRNLATLHIRSTEAAQAHLANHALCDDTGGSRAAKHELILGYPVNVSLKTGKLQLRF